MFAVDTTHTIRKIPFFVELVSYFFFKLSTVGMWLSFNVHQIALHASMTICATPDLDILKVSASCLKVNHVAKYLLRIMQLVIVVRNVSFLNITLFKFKIYVQATDSPYIWYIK